jgi:hypothetical protein
MPDDPVIIDTSRKGEKQSCYQFVTKMVLTTSLFSEIIDYQQKLVSNRNSPSGADKEAK